MLHYFFFPVFLWTCLSKYTWNDMTDTIKHFEQQTSSTLCSVMYLVHPKIKFHLSYWTKLWPTQILHVCCSGGGGRRLKKTHLGQIFQSVTSFETEFFFFSLTIELATFKATGIVLQSIRNWCNIQREVFF